MSKSKKLKSERKKAIIEEVINLDEWGKNQVRKRNIALRRLAKMKNVILKIKYIRNGEE